MACRRQKAWPTATFMDAVLSGFITPFGPLLLLYFLNQSSTGDNKSRDEENHTAVTQVTLQWITAARLWSQAFAGFLLGRIAGRLGPCVASSSAKAMPTAVAILAFLLSLVTQLWLGWGPGTLDSKAAFSQLYWARCLGGFFSGLLCSGMLSLSGPCSPSSSCERCDALPLRRNVSEIRFNDSFDPVTGASGSGVATMTTALRHADRWWQAGFVLGPLIGGLLYGRNFGWPWLGGAKAEYTGSSPAFVACAGVCLCVLIVTAWRSPGFRETARALVRFCIDIHGTIDETTLRGRRGGMRRRGMGRSRGVRRNQRRLSGVEYSSLESVQEEGEEEAKEDGEDEETPLMIEDVSTHSPGLAAVELTDRRIDGERDFEAGLGRAETGVAAIDGAVPARYIEACGGDVTTATEMWQATVRWREETGADEYLSAPRPNIKFIRECYPCYAHGRSKEGELVVYELAGRMRFDRLARAGVTPFDMQMYWAFFNDFVFSKLLQPLPSEEARVMTILDVGGFRLSMMMAGGDNGITAVKYLRAMSDVMRKHYPGRQGRVLVVNAPWWLSGVLSTAMSSVMSRGSREKPRVLGANFLPALVEYVDPSQIPSEYGGSSPYPLESSLEEDVLKNMLEAAAIPESSPSSSPPLPPQVDNSHPLMSAVSSSNTNHPLGAVDALSGRSQSSEVGVRTGGEPASADEGGGSLREEPGTIARSSSRQSLRSSTSTASLASASDDGVGGTKGGDESGGVRLGVTQRLASAVRRSIRGSATRAYLGVENKFRYDTARRIWIMEGDSRGGGRRGIRGVQLDEVQQDSNEKPCESDEVDGSESSLVRAIQAAQQARGGQPPVPPALNARSYATRDDVAPRPWRMYEQPRENRRGLGLGLGLSSAAAVILELQMAWSALDSALEVILPLWILGPSDGGGLGFSALGAGLVISTATAMVAVTGNLAPASLLRVTARSPVRALRLATGVQVVATILLSVVAGYSWLPLHKYRGASFAAAVFAYAVVRASNIVVRPSLNNLLGVAIGNSSTFGSGGGGRGTRRRTALKVVAVGVSQVIGVLVAGMIFARSAQTRAGATVLCFRLAAVAFVGVYMATLFVDATEGTGGFDAGWRGTGGTWLPACDFVEEAMAPASAGVRSMGGFGGMPTSTARRWGSSGSMAKES